MCIHYYLLLNDQDVFGIGSNKLNFWALLLGKRARREKGKGGRGAKLRDWREIWWGISGRGRWGGGRWGGGGARRGGKESEGEGGEEEERRRGGELGQGKGIWEGKWGGGKGRRRIWGDGIGGWTVGRGEGFVRNIHPLCCNQFYI